MQRAFIAELTRIGSVRAAAHAVGMTPRAAYALREKDGAESFSAAWEEALARGRAQVRDTAIERALHGEVVPRYRAGRFMGYRMRHNDRLLVGVLNSARAHDSPQADQRYRLERWENALRREAMNRTDGSTARAEAADEAWHEHIVWQQEMKAEHRRQRRVEIRAAVRRAMTAAETGPHARSL